MLGQRYHPAFENQSIHDLMSNRRTPFLTTIPFSPEVKEEKTLKIISWHIPKTDRAQREARDTHVVENLDKLVKTHQPQFITLQKVSYDDREGHLYKRIVNKLGDNYTSVQIDGEVFDDFGCITFYQQKEFKLTVKPKKACSIHQFHGTQSTFTSSENEKYKIRIVNADVGHNDYPETHEKDITEFLSEDHQALSIVVGNIISNNCFYSSLNTDNQIIFTQAAIQSLDPPAVVVDEEKATNYRMMICVDDSFKSKKLINGQFTIFNYQAHLRALFKNKSILVRHARNSSNDDGIGMTLSEEAYYCIQFIHSPKFQCRIIYDTINNQRSYRTVFVSKENIPFLTETLEKIASSPKLLEFAKKIQSLSQDQNLNQVVVNQFKNLIAVMVREKDIHLTAPTYSIIIEHFMKEASLFERNANRTIEEIAQSIKKLDRKLYGKRPINKKLKAAIFALIGCMLGAALSILFISGGSIAGMMLLIKGYTVATNMMIAIGGLLGATVMGTAGFFNSKQSHRDYHQKLFDRVPAETVSLAEKGVQIALENDSIQRLRK